MSVFRVGLHIVNTRDADSNPDLPMVYISTTWICHTDGHWSAVSPLANNIDLCSAFWTPSRTQSRSKRLSNPKEYFRHRCLESARWRTWFRKKGETVCVAGKKKKRNHLTWSNRVRWTPASVSKSCCSGNQCHKGRQCPGMQILVSLSSFVCVFQIPVEDKAKRSKRVKFLTYRLVSL